MTMRLGSTLALIVIILAIAVGGVLAAPDPQQATGFDSISVVGDATIGDDLTVTGDVTAGDDFKLGVNTSAIVGAQTLTPTASLYQFSPASVLTLTLATGGATQGDLLVLHNTVTTSTTVVDTGATQGGGVVTLGQDDVAGFMYLDGVWVELFSPDNS